MAAWHTIALARDLLGDGHVVPVRDLIDPLVRESDPQSEEGAVSRALLAMVVNLEEDSREGGSLLKEYRRVGVRAALSDKARAEVATWLAWSMVAEDADLGELEAALTLFSEAEHVGRSTHDALGLSWTLAGQARALMRAAGAGMAAAAVLREARRVSRELGNGLLERELDRLASAADCSATADEATQPLLSVGIGGSDAMTPTFETALRAFETNLPVLLVGEGGSGRTRLAKTLHRSQHGAGAFHEVRDSAAWLSSDESRTPAYNRATITTYFLPEIDRLAAEVQDSFVQRHAKNPDSTRLIATTRHDPWDLVVSGRITVAAYERICGVVVRIPTLRKRPVDIDIIVRQYLEQSQRAGIPRFSLTDDAWTALRSYPWPGNVEELIATLERLTARSSADPVTVVDSEDLPFDTHSHATSDPLVNWAGRQIIHDGKDLDAVLAEAEKALIKRSLQELSGNVTATAEMLGLSRQGLYKKMKRLDIDVARIPDSSHESILEAR